MSMKHTHVELWKLADARRPVRGPEWFKVTVETPYGALVPQTVDATSLVDALLSACAIPLALWFPSEDDS